MALCPICYGTGAACFKYQTVKIGDPDAVNLPVLGPCPNPYCHAGQVYCCDSAGEGGPCCNPSPDRDE